MYWLNGNSAGTHLCRTILRRSFRAGQHFASAFTASGWRANAAAVVAHVHVRIMRCATRDGWIDVVASLLLAIAVQRPVRLCYCIGGLSLSGKEMLAQACGQSVNRSCKDLRPCRTYSSPVGRAARLVETPSRVRSCPLGGGNVVFPTMRLWTGRAGRLDACPHI